MILAGLARERSCKITGGRPIPILCTFTQNSLSREAIQPATMPGAHVNHGNVQGGKQWGKVKEDQDVRLSKINEEIITNGDYSEYEDLEEKLDAFKVRFMEYDLDNSDDLDVTDVSMMMEKLGKPKNIIEIRKIIAEVDLNNSGTIGYNEFIQMMLGKKSSVLKLILMFEDKGKDHDKPEGIAPKKSLEEMLNKPNI